MNPKFKELYSYLKSNQMTDLDESTFYNKYSDPSKSKEIYSYLKSNQMTDLDETSFHAAYFGGKKKEPTELPSSVDQKKSSSVTAPQFRGPITSRSESSGLVDKKEEGIYQYGSRKDALYKFDGQKWYINPTGKGKFIELDDPDGKRAAILNKQAVKVQPKGKSADQKVRDLEDLKDLSDKETADILGWDVAEVKKASQGTSNNKIKPIAADVVADVVAGDGAISTQANSLLKARLELGSDTDTEKINKRAKYYDAVSTQTSLKNRGYDIDINGDLNSDKTVKALDIIKADRELYNAEESERNKFIVKINSEINKDFLSSEDKVNQLRSKFSKDGYVFQSFGGSVAGIGAGGESLIKVKYSVGGAETREEVFQANDPELDMKLKGFMAQTYLKRSEKSAITGDNVDVSDEMARFDYTSSLINKMAENPEKYGKTLVSEGVFVNHMKSTYQYLKDEKLSISSEYDNLKNRISAFNQNPTETEREAINNEIHELSVREIRLNEKYDKARLAENNFSKVSAAYAVEKAKTGGLFSGLAAQFAQGLTNVGKMQADLAADILPYVVDAVDPMTRARLENEGYSNEQIRDYASKEIKSGVLQELKKGITNVASLGQTTQEYLEIGDRGVLEQTLGFLAESIGTAMSGGGSGALTKLAFFSQSYNGMSEQMIGEEFDRLSEHEKKLISVPYALTIGALERLGFKFTTTTSKNPVLNKLINSTIARAFSSIPKDASIQTIERAISESLTATMTRSGLRIFGGSVVEGAVEGTQQLGEISIKNIANSIIGLDKETGFEFFKDVPDITTIEGVKEALELSSVDFAYGALGGLIMSGGENALSSVKDMAYKQKSNEEFEAMYVSLLDPKLRALLDLDIQSKVESGEMTQQQADEQKEAMNTSASALNKIPQDLSVSRKKESFGLLLEKDRLTSEINGMDESLTVVQRERIKEINDELQQISRDAVQEQATGQVPVQPETTVGEEMEGGKPEAETEVVTEKGTKTELEAVNNRILEIEAAASKGELLEDSEPGELKKLKDRKKELETLKEGTKTELEAVNNRILEIEAAASKGELLEDSEPGELKKLKDRKKELETLKEGTKTEVKTEEVVTIDKPTIATNTTVEVDRVKALTPEAEDGATFNLDGTKYEGGGLIVPVASKNTTIEEITPEMIADFVEENSSKIGDKNTVKFGIYKFPNSNEVSIDLNVVTPESSRDAAMEFGKKADQESLFDLSTFENVKTGGTGMNPKSFTDEQFKEIAKALNEGRVPNVFDEDVEIQDADIDADLEGEVEALGQLIDSQDIDATTSTIKDSKIKNQVKRAAKALSVVAKGIKLVVHDTDASYKKATSEEGRSQSTAGTYDPKTKTIHINLGKANARTVAHEAFHAILLSRVTSDKQAAAVTKRMIDAISSRLEADSDLKKYLDDFASNYDENIQNEEKLAELVGKLAENFEAQPETVKDVIRRWINKLAQSFGLKSFDSDQEVMEVLNTIARKLATGKKIKEKDVSRILGEKTISVAKANKRFQADFSDVISKMTFVYDKNKAKFDRLVKEGFITSDRSISNFDGKIMLLHQPDSAFSGEIYKNGELLVEGKGGMFYPIKFHEDGYFWASTSRAAKKMANDLNKIMEQNGGSIYMALTTAPSEKLMSSTTMSNAVLDFFTSKSLDKNFKISKTEVRDAVRKAANTTQVKIVKDEDGSSKEKLVGLDLKLKASLDINDIASAIKTALSSDNSSFEDRKTFAETLISNMADVIKSNPQAIDQFGKLFSEGIQNEYFKGVSKTGKLSISKANMVQALSNMLSEPMLKDSSDGSGSVYAVIELNGPVKAVASTKHESYPMAIQSADSSSKVKMHVLTDRVKWSNAFKDPNVDGPITKENKLKLFPSNTGVSKFGLVVDASGITKRNQISPDNSSNYANLTEDNDGNYVFYHYSGEQRQTIDPKKYGSKFTSRDEQAAISMVGGVSMYYTDPNTAEQGVGPVAHMVKIPKERVYDFNSDTDGLIKEAKSRFEAENPGKSFDPNTQLAYVTKIAEEKGYEMVVAQWVDKTRAQTTKEMAPVDVQVSEGNVIKKPFKENFESNKSKGWMSVIPKDKQEMLDKVYGKIYRDRNANDKYDDLYRLQEESVKYTQDKITEMIMNSDLSNELKSEYQEVLESETGKRKSERKQISDFVDRKQNTSASSIVSIARAKGFSEAAIELYLRKKGFSANEITSAMSVNDNVDVDKIFDRSKKAILDRYSKTGIVKSAQYLWNKIIDRQSDIKRIIKGIGSKQSKKAFNLLVTRAGAKGYANYRFKEASKKIYKNLKSSEIDTLDKIIYARRIVSINENRAARGLEAYRGIDGYSEAEARRDLDRIKSELGDKKFNQINGRADEYFNVFSETLKNLYESGRITEDTYNNLKDIEYSPIATIKYIIGDNLSVDEIDRQAEIFGITRKDVMELTDRNENEIIMDSKWLLMMNLMSVEARAWENKMLNSFAEAIETADADTIKALSEYVSLGKPGGQVPAGFTSISYFKDGKPQSLIVRRDFASQLMDIKNRSRGLEAIGKMTGTQILRFFATGGNPLFIIGNTAVDFANILFMSNVYSSIKPIGAIQLSYDFASKFLAKIINDVSGNKKYRELYKEFISHGGGMDFLSSDGLRELKRLRPTYKVTSAAQAVIVKYGNAMSYLGETSEQAMRLAVFGKVKNDLIAKYEKENGSKPTGQDLDDILYEAARESRETVDFSQGGDWTKSADLVMPYLNASMQGFRRPLDFMVKNPKGFASSMVQASLMAGGVAYMSVAALYRAVGDDDEDDKEKALKMKKALDSIPVYEKASYHIIFTGKKNKDGEFEYYRIKKLPFLSVLTTAAEQVAYNQMFESLGSKYDVSGTLTKETIENSIPFAPSEIASRNPMISGLLTYHFNKDLFTGQEVFRKPSNLMVKPEDEGIYDDKVEGVYKYLAPKLGLSPIRTKAFVEKIITSPSTNPSVGVFYGVTSGLPIGEAFSQTMSNLGEDVTKKVIRFTNKKVLQYNQEDEVKKKEIEIESAIYRKESKIYNEIKKTYDNGGSMSTDKILSLVKENFDDIDVEKYFNKFYAYTRNKNLDRTVLDIIYEDVPESQAMRIFMKYGSTLDNEELKELGEVMYGAGIKIQPKTWYIYQKKYQNKK